MQVKLIEEKDFISLLDLNICMYKEVHTDISAFDATKLLMLQMTNAANFLAVGLYGKNEELFGFVTGYANETGGFYFSGIYTEVRNTEWTKKLIESSFDIVQNKGFKHWEADATNDHITSILNKYGAKTKFVRLKKEF